MKKPLTNPILSYSEVSETPGKFGVCDLAPERKSIKNSIFIPLFPWNSFLYIEYIITVSARQKSVMMQSLRANPTEIFWEVIILGQKWDKHFPIRLVITGIMCNATVENAYL